MSKQQHPGVLDLAKLGDFFIPSQCEETIHVIGCGAVGSILLNMLTRLGLTRIKIYDFDHVEPHNIPNQMFTQEDVGKLKVQACAEMMMRINPDIKDTLKVYENGYTNQKLSGYVFLCVDNIDLRRQIATSCVGNPFIKAFFDFRMRLTDAQHYAADWSNPKSVKDFLGSMQFTHAEAQKETPVSACNLTLSVCPTVFNIVSYGVANFMNFAKGGKLRKLIISDAYAPMLDAF